MKDYPNHFWALVGHCKYFLAIVGIAIFITLFGIINYTNVGIFLRINACNYIGLDYFFYWATYLGDGLFSVAIILMLYFMHKKQAFAYACIFLFSGAISQLLKSIWVNCPRPAKVLESSLAQLHWVLDSPVQHWHSFPSGHTITAFALACFLSRYYSSFILQIVWAILAIMVAYSRIYLFQHFPGDVVAGAIIGICCSLFVMAFPKFWSNKANF